MEKQHLGKNVQLRLVKYFLLWSFLLLIIQGTSSATDMKCEIKSSCPLSGCQHTDTMIVDPDSNITRNCSIRTGMLSQGMTWKQARQEVQNSTGLSDLVLLQSDFAKNSGKMTCYCDSISFTRKLQIVWSPSSPMLYYKGEPKDLKCSFSGWPLPREVQWYKNGEIIMNRTENIYYTEDKKWKKGEETLRSTLYLPPGRGEHEGTYNCSAKNSIPGWKSEASQIIQMIYMCPLPKGPTTDSLEVLAAKSSNANLSCWIDFNRHDFPLCSVEWYLNDNQVPLKRGEKYKIVETETSRCKKEFILSIFNITENDRGTYSCHWICEFRNYTKAAVDLKVYDNYPSTVETTTESLTTPPTNALLSSPPSGIRKEWLLLIAILSASIGVLFMLCVWFVVKKKKASALNNKKRNSSTLDLAGGY